MNPIKLSVQRPVALIACVLIVLLFGLVALNRIPVQLAPDVQQPTISISTSWPGASPSEIEREIVERQEDALKGIENLKSMTASADRGRGRLTLEFASGTNMDRVLLLVANQLRQINGYPDEVREPTLSTAGTDDNPVAFFSLLRLSGNERPIEEYGDLVEDLVRERLQRVEGVSEVDVYGGAEQRLEVRVKPEALARYRLSVADLIAALNAANVSASAGDVEEGKRSYVVRIDAELSSAEAVRSVVVRSGGADGFGRVTLGEIAEVGLGYTTPTARIRQLGQPALSLSVTRETGANVIVVMRDLRQVVAELNEGPLKQARLQLIWNYDETDYIDAAIQLVEENIYIGAALAALVLFAFLRSFGATLVVSLAIPVSLIGAFVAMAALGRSINVISLAGLAFGIGMAIDSAIVVNENVFRLRERGLSVRDAAIKGAQQVWGAVFAGALTTVLVFLPLLVLDVEVGQLFRDLAVALSVTTLLSLLVAITVVPSLAARLLSWGGGERLKKLAEVAGDHAPSGPFTRFVVGFTRRVIKHRSLSLGMVAAISLAAAAGTWLFLPKLEYLPEGNRNLVSGRIGLPPGYNLATVQEIASQVEAQVSPFWDPEGKTAGSGDPEQPPAMQRFFFIALPTQIILGATAVDPERASELVPVMQALLLGVPGAQGTTFQPSIFGRGVSGGRSIELDVTGPDLQTLLPIAQRAFAKLNQLFPRDDGNQLRSNPGLELGAPELHVIPDLLRLADVGLTARAFSQIIDAFNDGLTVTEVTVMGRRIDLTLLGAGGKATSTQAIGQIPVVTPGGTILPASALGKIELAAGPVTIRHRDRQLTITLELRPAKGIPLESALESVKAEVVEAMTDEGLPPGVAFQLSGTADKLEETWQAMVLNLSLAMIVTYLVMAILFESFVYPLIMMLSVPLAAAGGVAGLAVTNFYVDQPLDMLTLIGFVILIGTVVNNSILIVHQALFHLRHESKAPQEAILEATRNRIRPIFMSTITAVASMLPLVIAPGAGSELYRGIGAVVVGGLSLSALLTLFVVPPMLSLVMGLLERKRAARHLAHEVSHPS